MYAIIASAAIMASSALAQSVGQAVIVNGCLNDIYLAAVPAAGGGYSEMAKTLSPGETFTQQWTELTNAQGWSLKLAKQSGSADIMQYEYTYHNDGIIWYDLSDVNGNPWDGDWEITATSPGGTCTPKQQAYRYATDDAYGMQACPQDSVITVTLCSGESQNNGGASSASSSVAEATSTAVTATSTVASSAPINWSPSSTTTPVAISTTTTTPVASPTSTTTQYAWRTHSWHQARDAQTTLATLTMASTGPDGAPVAAVQTPVAAEGVSGPEKAKRHVHHPRHLDVQE